VGKGNKKHLYEGRVVQTLVLKNHKSLIINIFYFVAQRMHQFNKS